MSYVRAVLERSGYAVVCSESGAEGLRLLESGDFLGVVSDMRTPRRSQWRRRSRLDSRATAQNWRLASSSLPATSPTKTPPPPSNAPARRASKNRLEFSNFLRSSSRPWGNRSEISSWNSFSGGGRRSQHSPPLHDRRRRPWASPAWRPAPEKPRSRCFEEQPAHIILTDLVMPQDVGLRISRSSQESASPLRSRRHDRSRLGGNRGASDEARRL